MQLMISFTIESILTLPFFFCFSPHVDTMVERAKHCVLQWADHARYISEKFNRLLARQTLVDVTLVCEEQKLRVHKLVLASNSTYFEVCLNDIVKFLPMKFIRN